MRLYIAVLDEFPDYMTPTLVAHTVINAHEFFMDEYKGEPEFPQYVDWFKNSFRKCVVRVNQAEFDKIAAIKDTFLGHENKTLDGRKACAIPLPVPNDQVPNVLKWAKLWKPK